MMMSRSLHTSFILIILTDFSGFLRAHIFPVPPRYALNFTDALIAKWSQGIDGGFVVTENNDLLNHRLIQEVMDFDENIFMDDYENRIREISTRKNEPSADPARNVSIVSADDKVKEAAVIESSDSQSKTFSDENIPEPVTIPALIKKKKAMNLKNRYYYIPQCGCKFTGRQRGKYRAFGKALCHIRFEHPQVYHAARQDYNNLIKREGFVPRRMMECKLCQMATSDRFFIRKHWRDVHAYWYSQTPKTDFAALKKDQDISLIREDSQDEANDENDNESVKSVTSSISTSSTE